jgi:hypothetical protein
MSLSGQITQWNLIFYGTNEPPQKNDPPRYLGNNNKKTVNELIHNSLENTQWGFITQDVSDSFLSVIIEDPYQAISTCEVSLRGLHEGFIKQLSGSKNVLRGLEIHLVFAEHRRLKNIELLKKLSESFHLY